MDKSSTQLGFTLVELMVTVTIVAITLTIGIPSFADMIRNNRILTQANSLIAALSLARSEAVKRGVAVELCKRNAAGTACDNAGNWEDGWLVFSDIDGNGRFADNGTSPPCEPAEDCIIKVFDPLPNGLTLRTGETFSCWVSYLPSGVSRGSDIACTGSNLRNDTFRLCRGTDINSARYIVVNNMGRPSVRTSSAVTNPTCP